jgi:hypothetical protein
MTKMEYREYIASEKWQQKRKQFLRWHSDCDRCGLPRWLAIIAYDQDLHVHHKSYARIGCEKDDDLEPLCRRCHEVETFGSSALHAPQKYKCEMCDESTFDSCGRFCSACTFLLSLYVGGFSNFFQPFGPKGYEVPVWQMLVEKVIHELECQADSNSVEVRFDHAVTEIFTVLSARQKQLRDPVLKALREKHSAR